MITAVSRETQVRLDLYLATLVKWQARINLVAPDTIPQAWERHFEDSLQLLAYVECHPGVGRDLHSIEGNPQGIPAYAGMTLLDLGTGAGFPGLVLAIARPDLSVHLVESDAKKIEFLKTVSRETGAPVTLHHARIEALAPFPVDIITARALAPLVELLAYVAPYASLNPDLRAIFLKGAQWQAEVATARAAYDFTLDDHPSLTSSAGRVLIIRDVRGM